MKNKDNVRKWVAALRSGEFQQGTGRLRTEDRLCCLGVACEVAIVDGVQLDRSFGDYFTSSGKPGVGHYYDGEPGYLPLAVMDWLGTDVHNPHVGVDEADGGRILATFANDTRGLTFAQIADGVERLYLADETELVPA